MASGEKTTRTLRMRTHPGPPFIYWIIACFVSCLAVTLASVVFAVRASDASKQAMCPILTLLDGVYQSSPPTTPAGKKLQLAVEVAIRRYDCPGKQ